MDDIDDADDSDDNYYAVEAIINHRRRKNSPDGYEYKIKWEGYGDGESTWQTSESLTGTADDLYNKYRAEHGLGTTNSVSSSNEIQEGPSQH